MSNANRSIPGPNDITRHQLPNGITLLIRENFQARSVIMMGGFAGGATFEDRSKAGLATLTAEALTYGTQNYDYNALHTLMEDSAMNVGFDGGRYLTSFSGKCLDEDFRQLAEIIADALRHPTFPAEWVDILKQQALTGLQYSRQDARYRVAEAFRGLLYPPDHIHAHDKNGTVESVSAITAEDLHAFHLAQYGPGEMIISVVGAVETQSVIDILGELLGDWENPAQKTDFSQPDAATPDEIQQAAVALPGKTQSAILLGVLGPERASEDYMAARIANNVLGVFGMMGRLGKNIRERQGLAYYSNSGMSAGLNRGAWQVSAGVDPQNVPQAIISIRAEINRMIEHPITSDDLADNQSYLTGRLPLILESNAGVATNLVAMERYKLGLDYLQKYHERINSITVEQAHAAFQNYWQTNQFCVAVAGPALERGLLSEDMLAQQSVASE